MGWRKIAALIGLAGVAVARSERRRQAYTPDEVRTRLRERLAESHEPDAGEGRDRR